MNANKAIELGFADGILTRESGVPDGIPIKGSRAIYLFNPGYELDI